MQSNFIEIALWHGCSPVILLHIFRTLFPENTSEWLFLTFIEKLHFLCSMVVILSSGVSLIL